MTSCIHYHELVWRYWGRLWQVPAKSRAQKLSKFRIHTDSFPHYTKLLDAFYFVTQEEVKYIDSDRSLLQYSKKRGLQGHLNVIQRPISYTEMNMRTEAKCWRKTMQNQKHSLFSSGVSLTLSFIISSVDKNFYLHDTALWYGMLPCTLILY